MNLVAIAAATRITEYLVWKEEAAVVAKRFDNPQAVVVRSWSSTESVVSS